MAENTPPSRSQRIEQNDPNGSILKSVKPDLMSGGYHQLSILRPTVIIDSHMHIQSGRCAPLQWVQGANKLIRNKERSSIESFGKNAGYLMEFFNIIVPILWLWKAPFTKSTVRALSEQGAKSTLKCGDDFMKDRTATIKDYFMKEDLYTGLSNLIVAGVVMTMDMEYAHVDGYYGLKIYNALYKTVEDIEKLKPCAYWRPAHGCWKETDEKPLDDGSAVYRLNEITDRGQTQYKRTDLEGTPTYPVLYDRDFKGAFSKNDKIIGVYFDTATERIRQVEVNAVPVEMPKDETDTYEQWEKQVRDTELTVLKYPLKFLPMFHYDPRRWQPEGVHGNDYPFSQVTGKGLYIGFKMYTAQGYRPLDPRLPIMEDFYARCCENRIPIMNHGTPGGAATFEKQDFINFRHFNDSAEDISQQQGDPEAYFNKHFVSPEAWEKVLNMKVKLYDREKGACKSVNLSNLHLCLAHFGGPTELGMEWNKKIIDMIQEPHPDFPTVYKYPNLYTDISSSFASDEFRDSFKEIIMDKKNERLKERILFGTDWYMTFLYSTFNGMDFRKYCQTAKEFLDKFDTSLWPKFTMQNPYRFYRLDQQIDRIARNIIERRENDQKIIDALGNIDKDKIDLINKEAAFIKIANRSYIHIEETPPGCYP